ncbi:MAG: hypothetical protein RL684_237 [Pseudomonadota bacterium]
MSLRYCLPEVKKRGYGLGNEFIPWARAFIAAHVLGAKLLPPAFGLNRRRYWRHFGTPLDDWLHNRALVRLLPCVEFTERDYLDHGGGDLASALRSFAAEQHLAERGAWVLKTSGLWGGFRHVAPARDFIRATLYGSRYAPTNLLRVRQRVDEQRLLVGMHVRLGDFQAASGAVDYRSTANVSLPIEWFCAIARSLVEVLAGDVQFLVVSDGPEAALRPLTDAFPCVSTRDITHSDCSDMLALSDCDLLACSASTFSAVAALVSDSPYLWFEGNLHRHAEGCWSIGDYASAGEDQRRAIASAVSAFAASTRPWLGRGFAAGMDGRVSHEALALAQQRRARRLWRHELVTQGVSRAD